AFFPLKGKADYRVVPWAIFTDPELARVGLTEPEARERWGSRLRVYRYPFGTLDRALTDRQAKGLVKILCAPRGRIVGAHVLGPQAGALIHEIVLAMRAGVRIGHLSQMIHVYPTLSEGIRRAADRYYEELLRKGWLRKAIDLYLRWAL
ncbi:MAG: NAD(P)/FAD-dependent oxidoreductase, partial [Gemmatimonadetes bacterium]|nr:NAD(P)/FAD-dependent oxidoreductase [Gemmatimonadota bacterium]